MVKYTTGTNPMMLVNAAGDIASIVTTSGLAWKVPGRVGDSGIVGAGQYTDNLVGAAGSTGLGECNILAVGGATVVDFMRRGMHPKDACLETLKRVMAMIPARWIGANGRPNFQLQFYAVNKMGEYGAAAMTSSPFAVCDDKGARSEDCAVLFSLNAVIPNVARDRLVLAGRSLALLGMTVGVTSRARHHASLSVAPVVFPVYHIVAKRWRHGTRSRRLVSSSALERSRVAARRGRRRRRLLNAGFVARARAWRFP